RRLRMPERYLAWVGSARNPDSRKQLTRLAATPRELPLVLVGPASSWAGQLPDVVVAGQLSDDDLAAVYSGAQALVFPSEEEGFGLPTVEALACGTPVAAFQLPVLHEVLGERATLVERGDLVELIQAAERMRRPAPAPPPWSWEDAGRCTWGVYSQAIAEGATG
ncbi:MAG: glycosyltransferase, partial [Solirubrobacterales bacterium]|nr:glycosyltransferase [Solirubrobacterales bacterium]